MSQKSEKLAGRSALLALLCWGWSHNKFHSVVQGAPRNVQYCCLDNDLSWGMQNIYFCVGQQCGWKWTTVCQWSRFGHYEGKRKKPQTQRAGEEGKGSTAKQWWVLTVLPFVISVFSHNITPPGSSLSWKSFSSSSDFSSRFISRICWSNFT